MKILELKPEQVIASEQGIIYSESILDLYFRAYRKGYSRDFPPAIVVNSRLTRNKRLKELYEYRKRYPFERAKKDVEFIKNFISSDKYYLIDGNHKSIAATLAHCPIHSLELDNGKDLSEVRKMVKQGELFNFPREETSIRELACNWERHVLYWGKNWEPDILYKEIDNFKETVCKVQNLEESVISLLKEYPAYMTKFYLNWKK